MSDTPNAPPRRHGRAFGPGLLIRFAVLLTLVTTLTYGSTALLIHDATRRALEHQWAQHLEDVAALTALDLAPPETFSRALDGSPPAQRFGRRRLERALEAQLEHARVRSIVLFARRPDASLDVLATAPSPLPRDPQIRLLADELTIDRARDDLRPASSSLYTDPSDPTHLLKSAYAPIPLPEGTTPSEVWIGVELPAEFPHTLDALDRRSLGLGAVSALIVLASGILLVRQRVHIPLYRLIRAMEGEDGNPRPARIRRRDELGILTSHYNHMVQRLTENEAQLRTLYDQARHTADYLQGYADHLVDGLPLGVVATHPDGRLRVVNPAARTLLDLHPPFDPPLPTDHVLARPLQRALDGTPTSADLVVLGDDEDSQRLLEISCAPFHNAQGEPLGVAALILDRTEIEHLRRAAERHQRLAAIGTLGAGLAHEIKNPLAAILGFAQLIERKADGDAARLAARLSNEVDALDRFLGQFLIFARDNRLHRLPTDLPTLLADAARDGLSRANTPPDTVDLLLRGDTDPDTGRALSLDTPPDLPPIAVDAALLKAALANLITNAVQHSPPDGDIALRASLHDAWLSISVQDHGPGVPLHDRERIFDPLFTTRAEGTGLGLAFAHKTIVAHGGKIDIRDAPTGGAEVIVRLPFVRPESPGESAPWPGS